MSELTAFIPAGGIGSRLRPHTLRVPKPLLLMGSDQRRIIDDPLDTAAELCSHTWISTDYLADQLDDYVIERSAITTLRDKGTVGSAGSLFSHYAAISGVDSQGDMLILPSDHIYEGFSVADFWETHREGDADITLLTVPAKEYGEYVMAFGPNITSVQKNSVPGAISTTGIFILRNQYLMNWSRKNITGENADRQWNIYHDIICPAVGRAAVVHHHMPASQGYWEDAGTPSRYLAANMRKSSGKNVISRTAIVEDSSDLEHCVILDDVHLTRRSRIKNAIISSMGGELAITTIDDSNYETRG